MSEHPIIDATARLSYAGEGLVEDVVGAPLPVLQRWFAEAEADPRVAEPGAMVVATVDRAGHPNARTVLLKALDAHGLTFFTNLGSTKGHELAGAPYAALVLLWHPMFRQVRVRGAVTEVDREQAAEYFASRPRDSRVASRASRQSAPIGSRGELEALVAAEDARWPDTGAPSDVPLPQTWGGYLVRPDEIELWVGQRSRLHDRILFSRTGDGGLDDDHSWTTTRLQP